MCMNAFRWHRLPTAFVYGISGGLGLVAALDPASAATFAVDSQASFYNAMRSIALDRSNNHTINITGSFAMSGNVAPVVLDDGRSLTINGNGHTIDGQDQYRPFFISSSSPTTGGGPTVTISDLNIANGAGIGGSGSGGGMGAGGGLFVDQNTTVILDMVNFNGSSAIGGAGRTARGVGGGGLGGDAGTNFESGGGGLYGNGGNGGAWDGSEVGDGGGGGGGALGNGGDGLTSEGGGGGGGFFGNGGDATQGGGEGGGLTANGNNGVGTNGGEGASSEGGDGGDVGNDGQTSQGFGGGGGGGGTGGNGGNGGSAAGIVGGGGGGSGDDAAGGNGGYFGGGGGGDVLSVAGNGGDFGGGGGQEENPAGNGGFGGGGGGASSGQGGDGGFGGGGGSSETGSAAGVGGFGGGNGSNSGGGGGAAFGGAVFVRQGGKLIIRGEGTMTGGQVIGGSGAGAGGDGKALATGIFLQNSTVEFNPDTGEVQTIEDGIGDDTGNGSSKGSLTKTGAGETILNGTNTYTGNTTVNGGILTVNGSITSNVRVNTGATLSGTGEVGGVSVLGGTITPGGSSIGTLRVNGNFLLDANSTYNVNVNSAGNSDLIVVKGTVSLTGSTLNVLAQGTGYGASTKYKIIDNDGSDAVVGQFGKVKSNYAFLTPSVKYNGGTGNDVVLSLNRKTTTTPGGSTPPNGAPGDGGSGGGGGGGGSGGGGGGGTTYVSFCSVAQTSNQCNVAKTLDNFPTDDELFLNVLFQSAEGAREAFDNLSGEIHASTIGVIANDARFVRDAVMGRLMQAGYYAKNGGIGPLGIGGPRIATMSGPGAQPAYDYGYNGYSAPQYLAPVNQPQPVTFWTQGYGSWGDFSGNRNAASVDRNLGGFVSGFDADIGGGWRAGLATGASFSDLSSKARYSTAEVESYNLGGYLGGMMGSFALRSGAMYAWHGIETTRAAAFPGFYEKEKADYNGHSSQVFGEVAYPVYQNDIAFEPFAGLAYVSVDTDGFRESGALAGLRSNGGSQDTGYSTLGLRAAVTMDWDGWLVTPRASIAWQHAFSDLDTNANMVFQSTGLGFGVNGVVLAEDTALLDLGLDFALGKNTEAGVSYIGQFGDGVSDNGVKGQFTWRF